MKNSVHDVDEGEQRPHKGRIQRTKHGTLLQTVRSVYDAASERGAEAEEQLEITPAASSEAGKPPHSRQDVMERHTGSERMQGSTGSPWGAALKSST